MVLDFDYTLFDAKKFRTALSGSLKQFTITNAMFEDTYKQTRYKNNKEIDYQPKKHLKLLAEKTNNDFKLLSNVYNNVVDNCFVFLYSDVLNFLQRCKNKNYKLILLSFGNPNFQESKVSGAQIKKYFNELLFTDKNKTALAHKIPDNGNVFFINDNPKEITDLQSIYQKAKFYLIKRPNSKNYNFKIENVSTISELARIKL